MPIVQVEMLQGRDAEKKRRLIRMVTDAVCEALDVKPESVRVIIREMEPDHYGIAGVPASERNSGTASASDRKRG
ncbi:MAG TPA: 2-hydroxymuconate tautomerase [Actinomycetota bacterium]|nr:2-hydroxymuconate tautomerase [Actinomycetota bacterium]